MPQTSTTTKAPAAPQPTKPKPPVPPAEFREGDIATVDAAALTSLLKDPDASEFRKAKACVRAGELGAKEAIPVLASLLADPHLSTYARYGLEPISDGAVDAVLRAALLKLKDELLIGVVNSIGRRRDTKAVAVLVKMMDGTDRTLARAAAAAIGQIGDLSSANELRSALVKTSGEVRAAVADALLICAERLIADGRRAEGLELYGALTAPDVPKPMRLAAMNGIIREETSAGRPR
jgi:HEAT repeat protein